MTEAQITAGIKYKAELQSKDEKDKNPKKVVYTEINLNKNTNKANLQQIYNQLGWEFNANLNNFELYKYLIDKQDKRKFRVKL